MLTSQLCESKNNRIIANIYDDKVVFEAKEIEDELKINGIILPKFLAENFNGQTTFQFKDPLFCKAFSALYSTKAKSYGFIWKEIKNT